jgi:NAD-dependent DNA ligase
MDTFGREIGAIRNEFRRSLGALVGIAQGLLCDRRLDDKEIHFLHDWLQQNIEIARRWPGDIVHTRVREVLVDGVVTEDERNFLVKTLLNLIGSDGADLPKPAHVTGLAYDDADPLLFNGKVFCLTGDFVYGPRKSCECVIKKRGGAVSSGVTQKLSYLVIGSLGSPEWKHGSFGLKIEKAMEYKRSGREIFIVREDCWTKSVGVTTL